MRVHLFGLPCDMDAILSIAEKYGLKVIKEPARVTMQCIKASRLVLLGLANISFYTTKNMTSAEGGMITTNNARLVETSRVTRQHGMRCRYYHDELGFNHRMSEVQAAIGLVRLRKLEHFNQVRREKAHYLSCHLIGVLTPVDPPGCQHVYHQYTIRLKDGWCDAIRAHLLQQGIGSEVYYPILIQLQRSYIRQMGRQASFPMVEHTSPEELSLPVPPALTQQDLEEVVQAENSFFQEN